MKAGERRTLRAPAYEAVAIVMLQVEEHTRIAGVEDSL